MPISSGACIAANIWAIPTAIKKVAKSGPRRSAFDPATLRNHYLCFGNELSECQDRQRRRFHVYEAEELAFCVVVGDPAPFIALLCQQLFEDGGVKR